MLALMFTVDEVSPYIYLQIKFIDRHLEVNPEWSPVRAKHICGTQQSGGVIFICAYRRKYQYSVEWKMIFRV